MQIFDTLLKPIFNYGSEITSKKGDNQANVFQMNWYKFILNVNKRTSNDAVLGELGRFPPYIEQSRNTLKYWLKLSEQPTHSILYNAFTEDMELGNRRRTSLFLKLKNTFDLVKWNAPLSLSGPHNQRVLCDKFVEELRNEFICSWFGRLHNDSKGACGHKNKLRTYRTFKIEYEMEPYLCFLNNSQFRHYLARFRCSAHKLLVETGRYIH